jgi:hypothetical protein
MSVTHSTAFRNTVCDALTTALGASPRLVFRLSGTVGSPGTAVATLTMSATPFPGASGGSMTANSITADTNATGNASAVANATLQTSGGTVVAHCSVASSGGDIDMAGGLVVGAGDEVSCSALTYTAMP